MPILPTKLLLSNKKLSGKTSNNFSLFSLTMLKVNFFPAFSWTIFLTSSKVEIFMLLISFIISLDFNPALSAAEFWKTSLITAGVSYLPL